MTGHRLRGRGTEIQGGQIPRDEMLAQMTDAKKETAEATQIRAWLRRELRSRRGSRSHPNPKADATVLINTMTLGVRSPEPVYQAARLGSSKDRRRPIRCNPCRNGTGAMELVLLDANTLTNKRSLLRQWQKHVTPLPWK